MLEPKPKVTTPRANTPLDGFEQANKPDVAVFVDSQAEGKRATRRGPLRCAAAAALLLCVLGVALGVGLGVGLQRSSPSVSPAPVPPPPLGVSGRVVVSSASLAGYTLATFSGPAQAVFTNVTAARLAVRPTAVNGA